MDEAGKVLARRRLPEDDLIAAAAAEFEVPPAGDRQAPRRAGQ